MDILHIIIELSSENVASNIAGDDASNCRHDKSCSSRIKYC